MTEQGNALQPNSPQHRRPKWGISAGQNENECKGVPAKLLMNSYALGRPEPHHDSESK